MKKPTIYEIKQSGVLGEYFFRRDTLRFFGQIMSNFNTDWHNKDKGIVRIYATRRDSHGQKIGITERFIDVNNWVQVTG
jgi:hypothetical protein